MTDRMDLLQEILRLKGRIDELEREKRVARDTPEIVKKGWEAAECQCSWMDVVMLNVDNALTILRFEGTKV